MYQVVERESVFQSTHQRQQENVQLNSQDDNKVTLRNGGGPAAQGKWKFVDDDNYTSGANFNLGASTMDSAKKRSLY